MSKDRYKYHCDDYDYIEIIYDTKECEECDSMRMATNLLNRQDQQIADLEAKLAESEKENKRISSGNLSHSIYVDKKIEQLKQQLAEKEKENIALAHIIAGWSEHNQDKIELLEKVKENLFEGLYELYSKPCVIWEMYGDDYGDIVNGEINKIIDTLIKEIKGE